MARKGCSKVCKFTPPHVEPPAALCLAVSERQSHTPEERTWQEEVSVLGEEEDLWVGGSSETRGFILKDPPPAPEYIISSFIPIAEMRKLRPSLLCQVTEPHLVFLLE